MHIGTRLPFGFSGTALCWKHHFYSLSDRMTTEAHGFLFVLNVLQSVQEDLLSFLCFPAYSVLFFFYEQGWPVEEELNAFYQLSVEQSVILTIIFLASNSQVSSCFDRALNLYRIQNLSFLWKYYSVCVCVCDQWSSWDQELLGFRTHWIFIAIESGCHVVVLLKWTLPELGDLWSLNKSCISLIRWNTIYSSHGF